MNERIRELAEQASEKIRYRIDPNTFKHIDDSNGPHTRFEFNKEKFAELIVRECSKVITNGGYWHHITKGWSQATPPEIAKMVREHFGVEE